MENNRSKVLVIGVIGHIHPENIAEFEHLLRNIPYFRFIHKDTHTEKIWLQKGERT